MNAALRLVVVLILPLAATIAADLGQEDAAFAPIADHGDAGYADDPGQDGGPDAEHLELMLMRRRGWRDPDHAPTGQWWAQALVMESGTTRMDGLRVARRRDAAIPDGQIAAGYHHDRIEGDYISSGTWDRIYVRGGNDALAARRVGMVAVGAAVASTPFVAATGEVGSSAERGFMLMGDVQIPLLHAGFQRDQISQTSRFGLEVRVPGSANTYAWSFALDRANTHLLHTVSGQRAGAHGLLAVVVVQWSPWNHVLFSGLAQYASSTLDGTNADAPVGTVAVGLGFGL